MVLPINGGNVNGGNVNDSSSNPPTGSPYEVIHSVLHFAIGPYFDAYCKSIGNTAANRAVSAGSGGNDADDKSTTTTTRRKITELELSFLHLQQNIEIGELTLSLHPVVENAVMAATEQNKPIDIGIIPREYLTDAKFLHTLQTSVNGWIRSIQSLTKMSRDPKSGTAMQEINFWLSMEHVLRNIEVQLQSPAVNLTLDILRNAKRFITTVSFLSDTGIKEASEKVARYNQLMRDFPLDELVSASSLSDIQHSIELIFSHLNKKLRISPYPVWKALALVEGISKDLENSLRSILRSKRLMYLDFPSFKSQLLQVSDIFDTWDENVKEFINVARELTRKRSEKFIPIRINGSHIAIKERLEYVLEFRSKHDQMNETLVKVLGTNQHEKLRNLFDSVDGGTGSESSSIPLEFSGINPLEEISLAYDILKQVDILDTSNGKCEGDSIRNV